MEQEEEAPPTKQKTALSNRIDLATGEQTVLSSHEAPASALVYDRTTSMLISASWDSTLKIHHPRQQPALEPATLPLPAKPFALALSASKLVVAMAARKVHIYDLAAMSLLSSQASAMAPNVVELEPFQQRESSLKFMTRAVACMPNDAGYACSSIEGRVAVEWFDASAESQARKYAFKCHRQPDPAADNTDIVYPVHALAFHPVHGTFVSGGGDGVVALWDAVAKRRIRQYQKYPSSVAAMTFSEDGRKLAVAVSPGFEDGTEDLGQGEIKLVIRDMGENEAKGRAPK